MGKIAVRATFHIHEGKTDDAKAFAHKCVAAVREREPRTIHYDWYLSQDGRTCLINELFEDSEAALVHLETLSPFIAEGLQLGDLKMEILGEPSDQLKEAVAMLNPKYYKTLVAL